MDSIYIPNLVHTPDQTLTLDVKDYLPDLETLTPIQGQIRVSHRGNYLEVAAQAETIVTLTCDRCLQRYNHRLSLNASEIIWLDEMASTPDALPLERELSLDELVETLSPKGYFDAAEWLYQQLCLALPQRQLCDQQCQGIAVNADLGSASLGDRRWASLEALKNRFSN